MTANDDRLSPLRTHTVPNPLPNAPFVPSAEEAEHRYYGLPSRPYFVARSSHDTWVMPTGMEAYLLPRELRRVGGHPLCDVWEGTVDVAMHNYLMEQNVQYTSLDPVRIGLVNESAAPVIIWVGVEPGSLSAERGIEVAVGLRAFLLEKCIKDVHVEIRESVVTTFAKLYKPATTPNPTVQVREAFSTALGITICAENTPDMQGTATLFFTVSSKPGKLFLLAPKHVLFRVDEENDHYEYHRSAPRRNVLLLGTNGIEARIKDIEKEIWGTRIVIEHFKDRLQHADPEDAQGGRQVVQPQLDEAEQAIKQLEQFLADVKRDWEDPEKRIIGHVVLSPPLILSAGNDGLTQDLAVIEVDTTKIDATNFIGNAIDLGTEISVKILAAWMHFNPANQLSFNYPHNRLLQFCGTLSNDEMRNPNPNNIDDRGDPTIMVFKRGCSSGLTVGYLNNIRSVLRKEFICDRLRDTCGADHTAQDNCAKATTTSDSAAAKTGAQADAFNNVFGTKTDFASVPVVDDTGHVVSGEGFTPSPNTQTAVLPRTSKSGAFSEGGDSGAAVINGWGAVVGMLTGGGGSSEVSDCTYVIPITFLLECLKELGFPANIFPMAADVFV